MCLLICPPLQLALPDGVSCISHFPLHFECTILLHSPDSPEEGEVRLPHLPRGSPPPEEDWAPCIRAIVNNSEKLAKGTLFIITQAGAAIGRSVGQSLLG